MNKYADIELRAAVSNKQIPQICTLRHCSFSNPKDLKLPLVLTPRFCLKDLSISSQSKLENSRLLKKTEFLLSTPSVNNKKTEKLTSLDSFKSIIKNLDLVTSNHHSLKIATLIEGEAHWSALSEGSTKYFKIVCQNKKPPIKVIINRNFGSIRSFLSMNYERPSEDIYDFVSNADVFEYGENQSWGCKDFLYLAVSALSECEFSLSIRFGKTKISLISKSNSVPKLNIIIEYEEEVKKSEMRKSLNEKVKNLIKSRRMKSIQLANFKDFVKLNKQNSLVSQNRESSRWEKRKNTVVERKSKAFEEKMLKKMDKQKKRSSKMENSLREADMALIKSVEKPVKMLVSIIFLQKSLENIKKLILHSRPKRLLKIRRQSAARLIQRCFKKFIKISQIKDLLILQGRDCLIAYHENANIFHKKLAEIISLKAIKESALNFSVFRNFRSYLRKIILVQRNARRFIKKTKERKSKIIKVWNTQLFKLIRKAENNRKYSKITAEVRDAVLKSYYTERLEDYMNEIREYIDLCNYLKLSSTKKQQISLPKFAYLPTPKTIRQLIESSLIKFA